MGTPRQSSSLALSADGSVLAVVNPDADSLSIIDTGMQKLVREIALGSRPAPAADGSYAPPLGPRSVDLSADGHLAYVACQWSGQLLTVDVNQGTVLSSVVVGAEPVSVLLSGNAVYVAVYQSGTVVRLPLSADGTPDATGMLSQNTTDRPWALGLDAKGATLYVTRFLLQPGVDLLDPTTLKVQSTAGIDDVAPRGNRLLAHGVARGLYGAAVRPGGSGELWLPHLLLATDTAQPELDFQSSAFPAVSVRDATGQAVSTLTVDSQLPGVDGAFSDVVSGPRALAFTPDGALALMLDMSSEDLLLLDAEKRVEVNLIRPLPGALPEGLVVSADGSTVYVDERASGDVAVLKIAPDWATRDSGQVQVDGQPIPKFSGSDPMPADLRLGQQLFFSANSKKFPMTQNFWMACSSCHLEGRSDGVIWRFLQGPRDTPSNAGGTLTRGFLQRNAVRNSVMQYKDIIKTEQGGSLDVFLDPTQPTLCAELSQNNTAAAQQECGWLKALAAFVDRAIPPPRSPEIDPQSGAASAAAMRGQAVFLSSGCPACHSGSALTDSGSGNAGLDLSGSVLLHDVGTCVTTGMTTDQPIATFEDRAGQVGIMRPACQFNTPTLHGLFDTAPYIHDGRFATLDDAANYFLSFTGANPTSAQRADLIAYLRSL